jgi:hypothetical protein
MAWAVSPALGANGGVSPGSPRVTSAESKASKNILPDLVQSCKAGNAGGKACKQIRPYLKSGEQGVPQGGAHISCDPGASCGNRLSDENCLWNVKMPWPGYGVIGGTGGALCVVKIWGHAFGVQFYTDHQPFTWTARLWDFFWLTYTDMAENYTNSDETQCFNQKLNQPINVPIDPFGHVETIGHVEGAKLCNSGDLLAHTGVYPPPGCYHMQLLVYGDWQSPLGAQQKLDQNSAARCF